jgi:hypothetical protein
MDSFTLKSARVVGMPSQDVWAQVHTFESACVLLVIAQSSEEPVSLAASGKQLFLRIEDLFSKQKKKNLALLRSVLDVILAETTDVRIEAFALSMVSDRVVYVCAKNGSMLLHRDGKTQWILQTDQEIKSLSGFGKHGDIYILASTYAKGTLVALGDTIFASEEPYDIEEELSQVLQKEKQPEQFIACIFKLAQSTPVAMEEAVKEEPIADAPVNTPTPTEILLPSWKTDSLAPAESFSKGKKLTIAPIVDRIKQKIATLGIVGKQRRVVATVFLVLLAVFAVSILMGLQKKDSSSKSSIFAENYESAQKDYDEGKALVDLNPVLAQKTLFRAKETVTKTLPQFKENSDEYKKLSALQKDIEASYSKSLKITTLTDVPLYFDLTLIKEGAIGSSMSLFEDHVVVLDTKNSALLTFTAGSKRSDLLSTSLTSPSYEAINGDAAFVLTSEGVERVRLSTKKKEVVIQKDDVWGSVGPMAAFATNVYMIDRGKQDIMKYAGSESGSFGTKRSYLGPGLSPDFSKAIDLSIDGNVWVLFSDGRMSKFTQGAPESFSINGLDKPLANPKAFYTDEESKYMYILDNGNNRVVVIQKDGTYFSQYEWSGVKDATDIVVSEKEKKILLLSGSKIYAITLNN